MSFRRVGFLSTHALISQAHQRSDAITIPGITDMHEADAGSQSEAESVAQTRSPDSSCQKFAFSVLFYFCYAST